MNQAVNEGYEGMRVTGDTAWLEQQDWKDFTDYEKEVNNAIGKHRMIAICSYSLDECGAPEIIDVVSSHQYALFRRRGEWELIESSEHKRVMETIRKSEEEFRGLFENSPIGMYRTTPDGSLLMANSALVHMLGYSSFEELAERNLEKERYHPEYPRLDFKRRMEHERKITGQESAWKRQNGKYIFVLESARAVYDENGNLLYYEGLAEDITERKQFEEELKSSREKLRNLSMYLQSAKEKERIMIAREIHDELGQILTALKMDLSWLGDKLPEDQEPLLEKMNSMLKLLNNAIHSVKRICTELRPSILDDLGFIAALEWQAEEFQKRTDIRCELTVNTRSIILNQDYSIALFRIFQESLTNIARHAGATKVKITLKKDSCQLVLNMSDNGKGITEKQISNPDSFGLIGMQERVYFMQGEFKIIGRRNKGTTVIIRIPLTKMEDDDD